MRGVPELLVRCVRRFLAGLAGPFRLFRLAWGQPRARAVLVTHLAIPAVLLACATGMGAVSLVLDLAHVGRHPDALAATADDDDDDDGRGSEVSQAAETAARKARADHESVGAVASAAVVAAQDAAEQERRRRANEAAHPGKLGALRLLGRFLESKIATVLATLGVLEWITIWIIREYHDAVASELARLVGMPAEEPPVHPRLRLDAGWLKLKAWRAIRFLLFMAIGSPPAWALGAIPEVGTALAAAWGVAWAAYWGCVFALANTHLAWERAEGKERAPWFVRAVGWAADIPFLGLPIRPYRWLLVKLTRKVWPACVAFEEAPIEAAGLATARLLVAVPPSYVLCRPMFPPAATQVLVARRHSSEHPRLGSAAVLDSPGTAR